MNQYHCFSCIILVLHLIPTSFAQDPNISVLTDYEQLVSTPEGRNSWTGRRKSSQCRGTITELKKDEATVLKSHFNYGKEPYPENYQCRWLFIPDDCNLGVECSIGTNNNRRRGRTVSWEKCIGGDYLRVLGYRGTSDQFYCGARGFNLTFTGNDSVALIFTSSERDEEEVKELAREGLLESLFGGFNCKIVCKNPKSQVISSELEPPPATTTQKPKTTTTTPVIDTSKNEDKSDFSCKCGETRQGRIVCPPGHNCTVESGMIPWQVAIVNKHRSQPWCGATIISDQYVLSAGHCMVTKKAEKIQVILGDHDWTSKAEAQEQRFNVETIKIHPRFGESAQFDYDFALLRLSRPIRFSSRIRPACLPVPDHNLNEDFLSGKMAQVSGWGVVDPSNPRRQARRLQKVLVRIMTNSQCKAKYTFNPVTDNMMCAANAERDACFGDSGGPMTVNQNGVNILEGVISWGKNCAKPQWPGVYARVRKVLPWLLHNTKDSNFCENKNNSRRSSKFRDIFEQESKETEYNEFDSGRGDRKV